MICSKCKHDLPETSFGKCSLHGLKNRCRQCRNAEGRARYHADPARRAEYRKAWVKQDRRKHPEKYRYRDEEHAERRRAIVRKHYSKDRDNQRRRMLKRYHAIHVPPWLDAIQLAQIQEFYDAAQARTVQTGIAHCVDHIHAIEGPNFQGLHVPWNLQVLTNQENVLKGHTHPPSDQYLAKNPY